MSSGGRSPMANVVKKHSISSERSEEHTSELQSQSNLVCRLLLEKKKDRDLGSVRVQERPRLTEVLQVHLGYVLTAVGVALATRDGGLRGDLHYAFPSRAGLPTRDRRPASPARASATSRASTPDRGTHAHRARPRPAPVPPSRGTQARLPRSYGFSSRPDSSFFFLSKRPPRNSPLFPPPPPSR